MAKYEKSFEKTHPFADDEPLVTEVEECEIILTEGSVRRIEWLLKFAEELAEQWEGTIIVSYDENQPVRDYVIRIIVKMMDFYNTYMIEKFADMAKDAQFVAVRSYPKNRDKVEMIIIQSNADEIYPEDDIL